MSKDNAIAAFIEIVGLLEPLEREEQIRILRAVNIALEPNPEEIEKAKTVCQDALKAVSEQTS